MQWLLQLAGLLTLVYAAKKSPVVRPAPSAADGKRVVCYYTNWSVYRPGSAKFTPQNINPYLCTHLIYAFGGLTRENGLRPFDKYQDIEQGGYAKFTGLKTYNKDLKTMLAIGGWNEGSARFSPMVADAGRRKELVKNAVRFLRQNHFDGLDLDWEYPAFRDGGKPRDKDNYALLVKELREEFDRESDKTGRPRLLLTMAVPAGVEYIDKGFDIATLNMYLDFMNILSYDYHSAFEPAVNHHSPLYSLEEDDEYNFDAQLTIDHTVNHYMKAGADRSKLVLGIPTYGRSYTLFNPLATELGSPADGPGEQGDSTREKGYLAYYEICENLNANDWKVVQPNPKSMGPYAYKGDQWVSYDDMDIIKKKAQYVNDNELGGIMFWAIDNDDFRGKCHDRPYPLIEAGKETMLKGVKRSNNEIESIPVTNNARPSHKRNRNRSKARGRGRMRTTTSTSAATTTTSTTAVPSTTPSYFTPEPPTTPDPGSDFKCVDEGFFPHPRDCKKYFWCLDSGPSNLGIVAHQFTCPSGLFFNKAADSCDYARNVVCNKKNKSPGGSSSTLPPIKAATSSTTRFSTSQSTILTTKTTTTTTELPVVQTDDEDEIDEDDDYTVYDNDSEEDPQALKELINLIKKLGGVEQLEKQLNLQNSEGNGDNKGTVTTPSVSRTLYSRIVNYNTARNLGSAGPTTPRSTTTPSYSPSFQNRPERPQNAGLDKIEELQTFRKEKPTYVTIHRERLTTIVSPNEESEDEGNRKHLTSSEENDGLDDDDDDDDDDYVYEDDTHEPKADVKLPFKEYITIQRSRLPTTPTDGTEDSSYQKESSAEQDFSSVKKSIEDTPISSPRYVTISRMRSTTETNTINFQDDRNKVTSFSINSNDETSERTLQKLQTTTPIMPTANPEIDGINGEPRNNQIQHFTKATDLLPAPGPPMFEPAELTTKIPDDIISIKLDDSADVSTSSLYTIDVSTTKPLRQFQTTASLETYSETGTKVKTRPNSERRRFRPRIETTTSISQVTTESVKEEQRKFSPRTETSRVAIFTDRTRPRFRLKSDTTANKSHTEQKNALETITEAKSYEEVGTSATYLSTKTSNTKVNLGENLRRFQTETDVPSKAEITEDQTISNLEGKNIPERTMLEEESELDPKSLTHTTSSNESIKSVNNAEFVYPVTPRRESQMTSKDSDIQPPSVQITNPTITTEEHMPRSTDSAVTTGTYSSIDKPLNHQPTKQFAYSTPLSTLQSSEAPSTLPYPTKDHRQTVFSTSQYLLQTGIVEVASKQDFSKTEAILEHNNATGDVETTTENMSTLSTSSSVEPTTSPVTATARRRGSPKLVRRRKFGPAGRNATNLGVLENGAGTRKFNFPRRRVLVNDTADKDMDLLESMDHLARDKPGQENLLLPSQVTAAQPTALPKTSFPVENRKSSRFLASGRTTLASLAARRATLSLSTTTDDPGLTRFSPRITSDHQNEHEEESVLLPTQPADSFQVSPEVRNTGPRAIFPQESGIIHPISDENLPSTLKEHKNQELTETSLKEQYFISHTPTTYTANTHKSTNRYNDSSSEHYNKDTSFTEIPLQSTQRHSLEVNDTFAYNSHSTGYTLDLYDGTTKSNYFTTQRPQNKSLFRSRNRARGKQPLRSQERHETVTVHATTVVPRRGSRVSSSSKEAPSKPVSKTFTKVHRSNGQGTHSALDYEYYDDDDSAILDVAPLSEKVKIHSDGYIECLDQGNFPHPFSCKKFISCAKMENSELLGWEYTCPRQLSFDPIGGICNWSAGLGCKE